MNLVLALKGAAMGIAEAIPGVSGGTIAFITGIYEELINTIKNLSPGHIILLFRDPRTFWKEVNGPFLLWLLIGMIIGLGTGIFVISHLLESHQSLLWAGFFGLVLGSVFLLGRDIHWSIKNIVFGLIGALLAYYITILTPSTGSENPLYIIIAGMIAVSAFMLPGVSGSFMMLLLGLYATIINGLKALIADQDVSHLFPISLFALGALIGLFSFARVLSFLFKKFKMPTMATMIGVLIGSLNKLWPWKKITNIFHKETGLVTPFDGVQLVDDEAYKIVSEQNIWPGDFALYEDPRVAMVVLCFLIGLIIVYFLGKLEPSES